MRFLLPLSLLGASALLLVGCGTSTVPSADIESVLREDWQSRSGTVEDVACPQDLEARQGARITCTVAVQNKGGEGVFDVRVTAGSVEGETVKPTYAITGVEFPKPYLESAISSRLAEQKVKVTSVACEDGAAPGPDAPQDELACQARIITKDGAEKDVNLEITVLADSRIDIRPTK